MLGQVGVKAENLFSSFSAQTGDELRCCVASGTRFNSLMNLITCVTHQILSQNTCIERIGKSDLIVPRLTALL